MVRQIVSLIASMCLFIFCSAQELERQVIGAASGNYTSADGIQINWTAGQPVTTTISNPYGTLTQGFQQASSSAIFNDLDQLFPTTNIKVYPNPFDKWFALDHSNSKGTLKGRLFNAQGILVKEQMVSENFTWEAVNLTPGAYFLQLIEGNKKYIPIQLIKN
jgi:hypothetical protein